MHAAPETKNAHKSSSRLQKVKVQRAETVLVSKLIMQTMDA
jgi:hypothetical protein